MKGRKWIAGLLSVIMLFSLTGNFTSAAAASSSAGGEAGSYHYDQLDTLAQAIYNGIEQMDLQTGTDEYDLVNHGIDGSSLPGNAELNKAMNAARYAYYADHPEVFYVDFPKLALRTTKDQSGSMHVYIGSGRNASYLIDAFSGKDEVNEAADEFDARIAEIVGGAEAVTAEEGESRQAAQIKYVHNEIIDHVSYRLEDSADADNTSLLGTPYGVLVKKQGVCEGYARAFKAVMDQLGISCILVQGVHQYDGEVAVNHMWNYVEITDAAEDSSARISGGRWYAVDATLDDPEIPVVAETEQIREYNKYHNHFDEYGKDGFEQEKYLLTGQLTMNERHFEAEEVAAAGGYRFAYPVLEEYDFAVASVDNDLDGFSVITKDVPDSASGQTITEFQFNYLGMTATQAREKGIYLVWRYYKEENGEIVPYYGDYGSWFYLDTDSYEMREEGGFVCIQEGNTPYVEIAATTMPPSETFPMSLTYLGDDSGLIARTGKLYNANRTGYVAPPFILRQTPTQTATINISDRFYHITVEYDEKLKLADGYHSAADVKTKITCRSRLGADVTGDKYSEIRNFKWDGDRIVEFDMKFSMMYADDNVIYNVYLEGLVGETSEKAPNPISYSARQKGICPSIMERNGSWDIFGKPTLLEGDDLSLNGWETSNGQAVSDLLKDRLTLVTTKTTKAQNKQIADQIENSVDETILDSATYNITLSVCKSVVVKTGHKVKVRIGFPEGYGPDDEGVTFKAYHFKRDNQGNVTGVEEIGCVVTQYGLILTCDAFSPFMIAAVEKKNEAAAEDKTLVVTASDGGTVSGTGLDASGIVKLNKDDSQTVTFTAYDGYQIESVTVCGKEIAITDKKTAVVTVNCEDVQNANNIVNANFVAEAVAAKDEAMGQTPVKPIAEPAKITMPAGKSVSEGGTLRIEPTVAAQTDSMQTFQWYRDGVKLEGKISKILEIKNVARKDAGKYTLKVTTTVDTVSAELESSECVVSVSSKSGGGSSSGSSGSSSGAGNAASGNTGSKTETITNPDGSTLVVETDKNGTKTTTSTAVNGVVVKTVETPKENVTANVIIPEDVGAVTVIVPADAVPGMVAVNVATGEVIKLSVPCEEGVRVMMDASARLVLMDRAKKFTDLTGHWAKDAIDFATAHELFSGTSEGRFNPDIPMTRAMLMTVLAHFDGEDTTGGSTWYEKGIAWAVAKGVSDGSNPGAPITREQLATILWKYAGSPIVSASLEAYPDADSVSAYAVDAMRWAVSTGIISGMGSGTLFPQGSATRAQVAAVFMHYAENLTK